MKTLSELVLDAELEMNANGYKPDAIVPDGTFYRFGGKKELWYVANEFTTRNGSPFLVVAYGDWSTDEKLRYTPKKGTVILTSIDRAYIEEKIKKTQEEVEKQKTVIHNEVAIECEARWQKLSTTGESPYLKSKQVDSCDGLGIKYDGANIFVPMRDVFGKLWSIQSINAEGEKYFTKGGKKQSSFHVIGELNPNNIFIAEGLSTGASIHMAVNVGVAIAFDAGNLIPVAQALREKYPNSKIIICGDDDRWGKKKNKDGTPVNTGREKAKKAARLVNAKVVFPKFSDLTKLPTDFNDAYLLDGLESVSEQLLNEQKEEVQREQKQSASTVLVELCCDIELFHSPEDVAFATVVIDGCQKTFSVKSDEFARWLSRAYYLKTQSAPGKQSIQDALSVICAQAIFDGEEKEVFLRIGHHDQKLYIDLGDESWEVIEVSEHGWSVLKESPVKFRRTGQMKALPRPQKCDRADSVAKLKNFLNVETENDFKLIIAWIMNAFNPFGPYLVLVLYGEQGTGKSTLVKLIREFVDPNEAPLRREPKNADDLIVSAKSNWIVVIDNMSYLPSWLSDDFCRLATEGSLSKRAHYTNDEEIVIKAKRPIILNGIDEFVVRGDLSSRTIAINLPMISEEGRRREKTFWNEFNQAKSNIMGTLLDGVAESLLKQDTFVIEKQVRMADAFHWASAAETAFGWKRGEIMEAYRVNQVAANDIVLNNSPLYPFIRILADMHWCGTATELLFRLNTMNADYHESWPRSAKALSDKLRRLNPSLRLAGIDVSFFKSSGNDSKRVISIDKSALKSSVAIDALGVNIVNDITFQVECGDCVAENTDFSQQVDLPFQPD